MGRIGFFLGGRGVKMFRSILTEYGNYLSHLWGWGEGDTIFVYFFLSKKSGCRVLIFLFLIIH